VRHSDQGQISIIIYLKVALRSKEHLMHV